MADRLPKGLYRRGDSPALWATIYVVDPVTGKRKRKALSTGTDQPRIAELTLRRFQLEADEAASADGDHAAAADAHFTRDKAQQLVDQLLRWHGVEPERVADSQGPKWSDYCAQYVGDLELRDLSKASKDSYRSKLRRLDEWLTASTTSPPVGLPHLVAGTSLRLGEFCRPTLKAFYRYLILERGIHTNTANGVVKAVGAVFNRAIDDEILTRNPAKGVQQSARSKIRQKQPFSIADLKAILDFVRTGAIDSAGEWETLILIALCTGARLGDCALMQWQSITFGSAVDPTSSQLPHLSYVVQKTERYRSAPLDVPLTSPLLEHLIQLRSNAGRSLTGKSILPTLSKQTVGARSGLSRQFKVILERSGVAVEVLKPNKNAWSSKGFHSFRATLPSLMSKLEVPVEVRMKILGHSSMEIHQLYTHFDDQPMRQALTLALGSLGDF